MTTVDTTTPRPAGPPRRAAGFTLMEIMIALGIFALGMIAVASVFPAAALLQKQTIDDLLARQTARNAEALLTAKKYDEAALIANVAAGNDVQPVPTAVPDRWSLHGRSFGSKTAVVEDRDFYWVPLVQQQSSGDWLVFVFILRRGDTPHTTFPGFLDRANSSDPLEVPHVVGIGVTSYSGSQFFFNNDHWGADNVADQIRPGDEIIDNNGTIYTVAEADHDSVTVAGFIFPNPNAPTKIWYGRPAADGLLSPTKRIIVLSGVVRAPP